MLFKVLKSADDMSLNTIQILSGILTGMSLIAVVIFALLPNVEKKCEESEKTPGNLELISGFFDR